MTNKLLAFSLSCLLTSCGLVPSTLDKYEDAIAYGAKAKEMVLQAQVLKEGYTLNQLRGAAEAGNLRKEQLKQDRLAEFKQVAVEYAIQRRKDFFKGMSKKDIEESSENDYSPGDNLIFLCQGTVYKHFPACNGERPWDADLVGLSEEYESLKSLLETNYGVNTNDVLEELNWPTS